MSKKKGGDFDWKFVQCFGEKSKETHEADIISALEFDESGDFLAIGDRGGRVIILEKDRRKNMEYQVMTEFQSHEPEFDYLKSLEIEEKINTLKWFKRIDDNHFLLTTNDKTIKMWKITKKKNKKIIRPKISTSKPITKLKFPSIQESNETVVVNTPKKVFASVHSYHINSISFNTDNESFISADDLRINLWNHNHNKDYHNIVDIKPENIEDLTEVITSASFHPLSCHQFMYSSSKGIIKLCDLRDSAKCNYFVKQFHHEEDPKDKTFFSEIIASISDAKFSYDGRYILQRDYMTVKIWDSRKNNKPTKVFNIHEKLRPKLCDLYENDCIFDKFECSWSGDGQHILTGSYKNFFFTIDRNTGKQYNHQANRLVKSKDSKNKGGGLKKLKDKLKKKTEPTYSVGDFPKKCLHTTWHPKKNLCAVAAVHSLYIFSSSKK